MNAELLVQNLKLAVLDSVVDETVSVVLEPPGMAPDRTHAELAAWFKTLSFSDQSFVRRMAQLCAESTLFGVFCVLDGVRAIESHGNKGRLDLLYSKETVTKLNDENGEMLHDIFSSLI